jgi:hypothetical protein
MSLRRAFHFLGAAGLGLALQACVVRESRPTNAGYGYGYTQPAYSAGASVSVGTPSASYAATKPPQPLYENITPTRD